MRVDCQECDNVVELETGKNWTLCIKCGYMVVRPTCGWCNSGECPECGGDGNCPACYSEPDCPECNGTGECWECDGTGKCQDCDGTGYEQ